MVLSSLAWSAAVLSFTPTGSVKNIQQVVVKFSTEMTALGDPHSLITPFAVTCSTKNQPKYISRWADTQTWVLDFDKPMQSGISCAFKIKADVKDLAGQVVAGLDEYSFSTAGPMLLGVAPTYGEIESDQFFVALADSPLNVASVAEKAYFEVQGLPDRVGVQIITGADRETVIQAAIRDNWRWSSYKKLIKQKPFRKLSQINEFNNFIVLAAQRRFSENVNVVLHWPAGILSQTGLPVEEPQKFDFKVIEPFRAQFYCERTRADRPCNPILNMRLDFSRAVPGKFLKDVKLQSTNGQAWSPLEIKKNDDTFQSLTFEAPFPAATQFKIILPKNIQDELGRKLENQNKFPLTVATDDYSPLLKFAAPFGILELKAEPVLPVSVRHIESPVATQQLSFEGQTLSLNNQSQISEIIKWYQNVITKNNRYDQRNQSLLTENQGSKIQLPKTLNEKESELLGIPLKKAGFYVIEMKSPKLGEALTNTGPMYVATAALVTDMAVHFKKGRESSLVWVTQLSNAKPVADAQVSLRLSSGKELAKGKTNRDGILQLGPLSYPCETTSEVGDESSDLNGEGVSLSVDKCEIFAFAQKAEDLSFVSSNWSKGIESYRYNVPTEYLSREWGPVVMHTILDRMVAQPGEKIQMKHILREHTSLGFSMMDAKKLPKKVLIVHRASGKTYTLPFQFDSSTGSALGQFVIPAGATLGHYAIYLSNREASGHKEVDSSESFDWSSQETGHFIVSEYRLPLMKTTVKIQGDVLIQPTEVKTDLSAQYLSGGPAKNLKVKIRGLIQPAYFSPDVANASEYNFFSEPLKPGLVKAEERHTPEDSFLKVQELTLNSEGGGLAIISNIPKIKKVQQMYVEMEYVDPSGEIKTTSTQKTLFPSESVIGLRADSWLAEPGKTKVMGVITDNSGKVRSGKNYKVEAFVSKSITHRKRLVGGFYSYDSKTEIVALGKVCEGKSDKLGRFQCEPKGLPAGNITLQAETTDQKNRSTYASVDLSIYAAGVDSWWMPSDSDRIDLIPEKNRYEPNDTAKFVVRSPFAQATVLVTTEREGVLDSFVTEIKRDRPIIEVPLKGNYAPNIFVSVLVLRGRVGETQPTALIDLARPSMKMGIAEIKVGWKAHDLQVLVKTDKDKYKTREKAQVTVQVKTASGVALPAGAEVVLVAVDESLMRLKENTSWSILREMMGERQLAVSTSSAQNQVIGRRHFGAKAKAPGGGGGMDSSAARDRFEPVLLWQPRLKLDSRGEAKISVPLNDSLTSFRIVAIATAGDNFYGDGQKIIQSTKNLILYSGFAPLVREGDQIKNIFTVRNTTNKPMKVKLDISSDQIKDFSHIADVDLKPSEAQTVAVPLTVPALKTKKIIFHLKAKDVLQGAEDSLVAEVKVDDAVVSRVMQSTLFQLNKTYQLSVQQPTDALSGKGGLQISTRPSLVSSLSGVKSYMNDYEYSCLEQKISRAVVLENKTDVKKIIEMLPLYLDSSGLLKFFPSSDCGSAQLNRYVMHILDDNNFQISAQTKKTMLNGLMNEVQEKNQCQTWWSRYAPSVFNNEAKVLLIETLSRYHSFDLKLLSTVQLTPNLWKTETVVALFRLLKRETKIKNREALLKQSEQILKSRVNYQGSSMNLQGELDWQAQWQLMSSRDQEALSVFALAIEEPSWAQDVGKMARGVIARLKLGHWDTTMANAWGVTQFRRFSRKFEKESMVGQTQMNIAEDRHIVDWKKSPQGDLQNIDWPAHSNQGPVKIEWKQLGSGAPWIHLEAKSAIPLKAPLDMGYQLTKKITSVITNQSVAAKSWHVGDVVNIELTVVAKNDQAWVVIRDAIPAGASHLGTGLSGSSEILDRTAQGKAVQQESQSSTSIDEVQNWPLEYEEKSQAYYTAYAAYLPRGTYRLNYRVRLNSAGEFKLPASRVEAMYSPETFGESPHANWSVLP